MEIATNFLTDGEPGAASSIDRAKEAHRPQPLPTPIIRRSPMLAAPMATAWATSASEMLLQMQIIMIKARRELSKQ